MIDEFGRRRQFSVRWVILNEILEDYYFVNAHLLGPVNGKRNYVSMDFEIYSSKSRNKAVPRRHHEDSIRELTGSVKTFGAEEATT